MNLPFKTALAPLIALVGLCASLAAFGSSFHAPCTLIRLGTNSQYRVACQIHYENNCPAENLDESELNGNDRFVNLGLTRYLSELCETLTEDERVLFVQNGALSDWLNTDFNDWIDLYIDALNRKYGSDIDLTILDVKVEPIGELARLLSF